MFHNEKLKFFCGILDPGLTTIQKTGSKYQVIYGDQQQSNFRRLPKSLNTSLFVFDDKWEMFEFLGDLLSKTLLLYPQILEAQQEKKLVSLFAETRRVASLLKYWPSQETASITRPFQFFECAQDHSLNRQYLTSVTSWILNFFSKCFDFVWIVETKEKYSDARTIN